MLAFVALLVAVLLVTLAAARSAPSPAVAEPVQIITEPPETPEPVIQTWMKYDVPLDDDLQQYIEDLCLEYGIDAALVMAVIENESGFDPNEIGDYGNSFGLMQIWATEHTDRCIRLGAWNLFDPRANVRVGIDYLAELLAEGNGIEWALSWYNGHGGDPCPYAVEVLADAERFAESAELTVRSVG